MPKMKFSVLKTNCVVLLFFVQLTFDFDQFNKTETTRSQRFDHLQVIETSLLNVLIHNLRRSFRLLNFHEALFR